MRLSTFSLVKMLCSCDFTVVSLLARNWQIVTLPLSNLDSNRVSHGRDCHDSALGGPVARLFDALALYGVGCGIHLASIGCGFATNIETMIVMRAIQDLSAGR